MVIARALRRAVVLLLMIAMAEGCGTASQEPTSHSDVPTASTATPTPAASPTADSQLISVNGIAQIQLPTGWSLGAESSAGKSFTPPGGASVGFASIGETGGYPGGNTKQAIDSAASDFGSTLPYKGARLPNVTANGAALFHLQGQDDVFWYDDLGTLNEGHLVTVSFQFSKTAINRGKATQLVNQVMANFKLL